MLACVWLMFSETRLPIMYDFQHVLRRPAQIFLQSSHKGSQSPRSVVDALARGPFKFEEVSYSLLRDKASVY